MTATAVFVSYSRRDESWKSRLVAHLALLAKSTSITAWDDTRIPWGSEWKATLEAELTKANVAILLLSADFLSSDFIREVEMPILLAREAEGQVKLMPIILRPCAWQTVPWLAKRKVYPPHARSLSGLSLTEAESEIASIVGEVASGPGADSAQLVASREVLVGSSVPKAAQRAGEDYYNDVRGGPTSERAERLARQAANWIPRAIIEEHSGPSQISLVLVVPDGNRVEVAEVPVSIRVRELLDALLDSNEFSHLGEGRSGSSVVADRQTLDGRNLRLNPGQSLYDQNVRDGDTLRIHFEARAGCFPLDTLIRMTDGRDVLLETLRAGDKIASPRPLVAEDFTAVVEDVVRERTTRLVIINNEVRITPDHGVFCVSRGAKWILASRLRLGDFLLNADRRVVAVSSLALVECDLEVGNLVLHRPADAFVANGLVVFGTRRTELGFLQKSARY